MPTSLSKSAARRYLVAAFGIPSFEQEIIARIFALTTVRPQSFELASIDRRRLADIMFVDMDNPSAVASWESTLAALGPPAPPTVWVARDNLEGRAHCLRRPFIASRLLKVFDEVVNQHFGDAERPIAVQPQGSREADNLRQQVADLPLNSRPRHRALVVDDSLSVRKQVGLALARISMQVDFADSGEAALLKLEEADYDIIFLDVVMPGMDGYEVCKNIKRDRRRKQVPVVMLTGKSSPFDKVRGKLSGCNSYLTKPVSRQDFMKTIAKYLRFGASSG